MGLFGLLSTQEFNAKMTAFQTWVENKMADTSNILNDVAAALRDKVFPGITELLAENTSLRQENAGLKGEDVAESAAAQNVLAASNEVSGLFDDPELPDVPPVEEPPADTDPVDPDGDGQVPLPGE